MITCAAILHNICLRHRDPPPEVNQIFYAHVNRLYPKPAEKMPVLQGVGKARSDDYRSRLCALFADLKVQGGSLISGSHKDRSTEAQSPQDQQPLIRPTPPKRTPASAPPVLHASLEKRPRLGLAAAAAASQVVQQTVPADTVTRVPTRKRAVDIPAVPPPKVRACMSAGGAAIGADNGTDAEVAESRRCRRAPRVHYAQLTRDS